MNIRRKGTAVIFLRGINMLDSGHLWVDMHPKAQFTGIGRSPPGCYWGRHSHQCWEVPMVATHRVPQPRGTWPGELGSDWDLFIAWVGGRRQEASAAPAVEWPIPGPLAGVLLSAARISGSGGPWLVLGVQERKEDEVGVEQAPPDPCRWSCCALASPFVEEGHAVMTPAASVSCWPQGSLCVPETQSPGSSGVYGCTGAGQLETPSPRYEEVQMGGRCHWSSPLRTTFWRRWGLRGDQGGEEMRVEQGDLGAEHPKQDRWAAEKRNRNP